MVDLFFDLVTEIEFKKEVTESNLKMRVTPVSLPFDYQYTDEGRFYKVLWVSSTMIAVFFLNSANNGVCVGDG